MIKLYTKKQATCPTYYLEIKSDKTFQLFAEEVFKEDTSIFDFELDSSRMGYFKGKLDDANFQNLNKKYRKYLNLIINITMRVLLQTLPQSH
uniref:DUF6438 domain-containing protein n=1 Tax=Chryseobacterium schmidteae TaxID=2730404 RepID=UPI0037445DD3